MAKRVAHFHPDNWSALRGLKYSELETWVTRKLWEQQGKMGAVWSIDAITIDQRKQEIVVTYSAIPADAFTPQKRTDAS